MYSACLVDAWLALVDVWLGLVDVWLALVMFGTCMVMYLSCIVFVLYLFGWRLVDLWLCFVHLSRILVHDCFMLGHALLCFVHVWLGLVSFGYVWLDVRIGIEHFLCIWYGQGIGCLVSLHEVQRKCKGRQRQCKVKVRWLWRDYNGEYRKANACVILI